ISIRPKDRDDRRITMTRGQLNWVGITSLGLLPLGIVITGVSVWWRRREPFCARRPYQVRRYENPRSSGRCHGAVVADWPALLVQSSPICEKLRGLQPRVVAENPDPPSGGYCRTLDSEKKW